VEADDRDVLGDAQAELVERLVGAQRRPVVPAEDRCDRLLEREQGARPLVAAAVDALAGDDQLRLEGRPASARARWYPRRRSRAAGIASSGWMLIMPMRVWPASSRRRVASYPPFSSSGTTLGVLPVRSRALSVTARVSRAARGTSSSR